MKKLFLLGIVAVIAAVAMSSCKNDEDISAVSAVTLEINMPADFPAEAKYNGDVVLQDRNSSKSYKVAAVDGKAVFAGVRFGVYDASVAATMTHDQFAAVAPELAANLKGSIALNGNKPMLSLIDESAAAQKFAIDLMWSVPSSLVISKVYCFGTTNLNDKPYNIDKYWEIYNNSEEVIYADGLCLGEAYGSAVSASTYDVAKAGVCYMQRIVRIPGSGAQYPIEPGKSIVVAQNAKNHIDAAVVTQTVDLSGADFECYVEGATLMFPADNGDVPNLEQVFAANTNAAKFGAGQGTVVALIKMTAAEVEAAQKVLAPGTDTYGVQYASYCLAVPNDKVLDAVDCYRKSFESRKGKHVPDEIDASYAVVEQKGIAERKISYVTPEGRKVLQDTNNSTQDFVLVEPRSAGAADHLVPRDYDKPEIQPAQ